LIGRLSHQFAPHVLAGALCAGFAGANFLRVQNLFVLIAGAALLVLSAAAETSGLRVGLAGTALAFWGLWWGTVRLDALDRSPLRAEVGRAEQALVEVTGPARHGRFNLRIPARMLSFGPRRVREPILLELPLGRSPPQGARLRVLGEIELPSSSEQGFNEEQYLRRSGMHVVLRGDRWRIVGRRAGLGGLADRLRAGFTGSLEPGTSGERRRLLLAIVLGEDGALSEDLRDRFRASGLYHLLAVSGQNVALLAGGVLAVSWLAGIGRGLAEGCALLAILAYVLAVGAQPSVIRAGVAGALGSLAWLAARERDRWYFMLVGALLLLGWNPYDLLDPGFQLSFAAVAAIFVLAPRLLRRLEGYPLPQWVRVLLAVSAACGLATAPILSLQFGEVPIYAIPANLLAEPAMPPLLGLSFAAAALHPLFSDGAALLAALASWCAAYIAVCARLIGGLPFALLPSPWAPALMAAGTAAYAWRRWRAS
jgi:competence protein ComEC